MENPSSVNVTESEQAVFQCNHSSASHVGWLVNDTTLSMLDNTDITTTIIRQTSGQLLYQLEIQTLKKYNQTTIHCLAFLDGHSEMSTYAVLLIQGIKLN